MDKKIMSIDREITPRELADRWRMSINTLKVWRCIKKGPSYNKRGANVTYHMSDILRYEFDNKILIQNMDWNK